MTFNSLATALAITATTAVAAVEGRAAFLVTGDPHLLAVTEYEGVRIMNPRAFLELLGS